MADDANACSGKQSELTCVPEGVHLQETLTMIGPIILRKNVRQVGCIFLRRKICPRDSFWCLYKSLHFHESIPTNKGDATAIIAKRSRLLTFSPIAFCSPVSVLPVPQTSNYCQLYQLAQKHSARNTGEADEGERLQRTNKKIRKLRSLLCPIIFFATPFSIESAFAIKCQSRIVTFLR